MEVQDIQTAEKRKRGPKGPQTRIRRYQVYLKQYDGTLYDLGIFSTQIAIAKKLSEQLNEKFSRATIDNILRGKTKPHSKWIKIMKL